MRIEYMALIGGMALVIGFTRFASLAFFRKTGIPASLARWLRHVPAAVFSAIIAPAILMPGRELDISTGNHYLLAALITAALAWRYNNFALTTAMGTVGILLFRLFAP